MLVASFANIFSHSMGCLFILFMVSFAMQKFISLIRFYLFLLLFWLLWETDQSLILFLSEKKKLVAQSCLTLHDPVVCSLLGSSRQEYWSGLPFPSPRDLPKPGIKPQSPALQADSLQFEPPGKPQ